MNNKNIACPFCGSTDVVKHEESNFKQLTLGPEFQVEEISYKCNSCEEEGDFNSENEMRYQSALKVAEKDLMKNMLSCLNNQNISMAFFERAFELPARTLTRWKNGDFSASALALVRTVKTFPWISEVAENRFDYNYAMRTMLKQSANFLGNIVKSQQNLSVNYELSANSCTVNWETKQPNDSIDIITGQKTEIALGG